MDKPNEISIIRNIAAQSPYVTEKGGRRFCMYCKRYVKNNVLGLHGSNCVYLLATERYKELLHFKKIIKGKAVEVSRVRTVRSL